LINCLKGKAGDAVRTVIGPAAGADAVDAARYEVLDIVGAAVALPLALPLVSPVAAGVAVLAGGILRIFKNSTHTQNVHGES